jgi:hypothetical protein
MVDFVNQWFARITVLAALGRRHKMMDMKDEEVALPVIEPSAEES